MTLRLTREPLAELTPDDLARAVARGLTDPCITRTEGLCGRVKELLETLTSG